MNSDSSDDARDALSVKLTGQIERLIHLAEQLPSEEEYRYNKDVSETFQVRIFLSKFVCISHNKHKHNSTLEIYLHTDQNEKFW